MTDWFADIDFDRPEVVAHYDELPLWSAPFGQMILERVPLAEGQTVVDVGCGTGFLTVELAQRCGAASRVVAIDPWVAAMDVLRSKCHYLGLDNVEMYAQDARTLPCPDASVDVIVSNLGINNFDDPIAVLRECRRVLRASGTLLITTNLVGHMAEFYDAFCATLLALRREDLVPALDAEIAHRATLDSVTDRLSIAGFELVDVATSRFLMRYATGTAMLRHYFIRLGFLPGWRDVVDPRSVDAVFGALETRLNQQAADRGGLTLTVPTACITARLES